ncbi:MAG: 4Fe-4S binding protein, partial [Candidatus Helarchaeota archaeon]
MKIGVFICHCGTNIGGIIDIEKIKKELKDDPDLVVFDNPYTCSEPGLLEIKKAIKEENLDRIVIAACSPKMHGSLFQDVLTESGINPFLLDIANIREQDSWVHRKQPLYATTKALDLIKMAIAKVKQLEPLEKIKIPIKNSCLVIGGGIAGINAALSIANMGIKVYLVEKSPSLGGYMAHFDKTFPTLDCSICILAPMMVETGLHSNIEVFDYSEVKEVRGHIGNFKVTIIKKPRFVDPSKCTSGCIEDCSTNCPIEVLDRFNNYGSHKAIYIPFPQAVPLMAIIDKDHCIGCGNCEIFCKRDAIDFTQKPEEIKIEVGTIINAIGFEPYDPTPLEEYGYGIYKNVITSLEMERILSPFGPTKGKLVRPSDGKPFKRVVFVQCVGSRNLQIDRLHCSRVCCMSSMKYATQIKDQIPDAEIIVFYIDIRAYGKGFEEFYEKTQRQYGVNYIKGKVAEILEDPKTKNLIVRAENTILGNPVETEAELVVLAIGIDPPKDADKIASILNISRSPDGFFQESHPKLRPEESSIPGIFLAGCVQGPKNIHETVVHAKAAALKAATIIHEKEILIDPISPTIDYSKCTNCKLCVWVCDSKAIQVENNKITLNA